MGKKKPKATAGVVPVGKTLQIKWVDGDCKTTFANQLLVQNDGDEIVLSFFEIRPPFLLGTDEQKKAHIEALKAIEANCVSRVVIGKSRLAKFIEAMQTIQAQIQPKPSPHNGNGKSNPKK